MTEREGGTFQYANPAIIHWGEGCVERFLLEELKRTRASRVFVISTASVGRNPALLGTVERLLGERLAGTFARIPQHAPASAVAEAAAQAREAHPDALLSMGGGSPIDAAKAVAFSLATGVDLSAADAPRRAREVDLAGAKVLPHFAIPTTLSVAELASAAGYSAEGSREKVGVAARELLCEAVFYDASFALHTPVELWLATGIRAVDHAVETLLAARQHPLPDAAALAGLSRLGQGLLAVKADPASAAARTECQLGAWFAYLLPGPAARGLSHTLGKRLGSRHGIPHGVTSCLLLPHVMRFYAGRKPAPLSRVAMALGAVPPEPLGAAAAVESLIGALGLPRRISSFGLTDKDLVEAVKPVAGKEFSEADLLGILRAAF